MRLFALLPLLLAGSTLAQSSQPAIPASLPAELADLPHLRLDPAAKTIEMDAKVNLRQGPLELFACLSGTKEHESILVTDARPSHLHACLLALGLAPGKPAHTAVAPDGKEVFVPPQGAELEISLRYTDAAAARTDQPHDWLLGVKSQARPDPLRWIFVGSVMVDRTRYGADIDGDVICLANFVTSVIDVPFESSADNSMLEFAANPQTIPPMGTAVTVVIRPKGQAAPVARVTFDVDRFGRYMVDGRRIEPEDIRQWAWDFRDRHAKPYAVINADARALVFDVERLKGLLTSGGISDISVEMEPLAGEVLPRTPEQLAKSLRWWSQQLAMSGDVIIDPAEQARQVLTQIEDCRRDLEDLQQLWRQYQAGLDESLRQSQAATAPSQPAASAASGPSKEPAR